jgi:HAD superfamily hydrolase (TIGR01450 family)
MTLDSPEFIPEFFLIDLDGVVYEDGMILPGVFESFDLLRYHNKQFVFITNNSGTSQIGLYKKLQSIGINCELDQIFASGFMMADYIKYHPEYCDFPIYLIATKELKSYYKNLGLNLVDEATKGIVAVLLDLNFNYHKLEQASFSLQKGSRFFVANLDTSFPIPGALRKPGLGALVQAIAVASQKQPDLIYGKPYPHMVETILTLYKVPKERVIIIGDSLESDIELGQRFGIKSALISPSLPLSQGDIKPDYYFDSLKSATDYFLLN